MAEEIDLGALDTMPTFTIGGGRSSGGGGGITVNFAPVIHGGSGDIANQVKALIPELIRQIEAKLQRKQALSY